MVVVVCGGGDDDDNGVVLLSTVLCIDDVMVECVYGCGMSEGVMDVDVVAVCVDGVGSRYSLQCVPTPQTLVVVCGVVVIHV